MSSTIASSEAGAASPETPRVDVTPLPGMAASEIAASALAGFVVVVSNLSTLLLTRLFGSLLGNWSE
jgi:hypothetical protein